MTIRDRAALTFLALVMISLVMAMTYTAINSYVELEKLEYQMGELTND